MKKRIFKDDVLNALEDEPLCFGTFAKRGDGTTAGPYDGTKIDEKGCSVCAVGAILRQKTPDMSVPVANEVGDELTEGAAVYDLYNQRPTNWLSALSMFWESLGRNRVPVREAREIAIDWVEENFPDSKVLGVID